MLMGAVVQARWGREKPKVKANDPRNARTGCFVVRPRVAGGSRWLSEGGYPRPKGDH